MRIKKTGMTLMALVLATSVALSGPVTVIANAAQITQQQQPWEDLVDEIVKFFNGATSKSFLVEELNKLGSETSIFDKLYNFLNGDEKAVLEKYALDLGTLKTVVQTINDSEDLSLNDLNAETLKEKLTNNKQTIISKLGARGVTVDQIKTKIEQLNAVRTLIKGQEFLQYKDGNFSTTQKLNTVLSALEKFENNDIIALVKATRVQEVIAKFNTEATPELKADVLAQAQAYGIVDIVKETKPEPEQPAPGGGGGGGGGTLSPSKVAEKEISKAFEGIKDTKQLIDSAKSIIASIEKLDAEGAKKMAGTVIDGVVAVLKKTDGTASMKEARNVAIQLVQALANQVAINPVELKDGKATLSGNKVAEQVKAAREIIEQLHKTAKENDVQLGKVIMPTVRFALDKEVADVAVVVPADVWKAVGKEAKVAIETKGATLILEHNTFKGQAYTVNVKVVDGVVELTTDAQFAKPITVAFPVDKKVKNYPTVFHIVGDKEIPAGGMYDEATGTVTTVLPHFSFYTVKEAAPKAFEDMQGVTWQRKAINELSAKGYIAGMSEEAYAPKENMTRAQFAAMITRAVPTIPTDAKVTLTDLKEEAWYYNSVVTAVSEGWLVGREGNKFDPNASITRQEVVAVLSRILAQKGYRETADAPEGINVDAWAKNAVSLYLREVDTQELLALDMKVPATRAEVAVMIYELLTK